MCRAYKYFDKFINYHTIEESDFETLEKQRFTLLIRSVFALCKANRLDVITKFTKISGMLIFINVIRYPA